MRDLLIRGRELAINAADGGSAETALHLAATKGECAMLEVLMRAKTVNLNPLDARGRWVHTHTHPHTHTSNECTHTYAHGVQYAVGVHREKN